MMRRRYDFDIALAAALSDIAGLRPYVDHLNKAGSKAWVVQLEADSPNPLALIQENLERSRSLILFTSARTFGSEWPQLEAHLVRFRSDNQEGRYLAFAILDQTLPPELYAGYPVLRSGKSNDSLLAQVSSFAKSPRKWRVDSVGQGPLRRNGLLTIRQFAGKLLAFAGFCIRALKLSLWSFVDDGAYCDLAELLWSDKFGNKILRLFLHLIVAISPNFVAEEGGEEARDLVSRSWTWFWFGFSAALLICLVGCGVGCMLQGTFVASDKIRFVSFADDHRNLFLYSLVCPLYCGCCLASVRLAADYWSVYSNVASRYVRSPVKFSGDRRRRPLALLILALFTVASTTMYVSGILRLPLDKPWTGFSASGSPVQWPAQLYWFATETASGKQSLNGVGLYYALVNCLLLFVTVTGVTSYYSLSFEIIRIARVKGPEQAEPMELIKQLDAFRLSYLHARVLVFSYALNVYVWASSPLGAGTKGNLLLATIMFWLLTGHFFSFPVNFIERRFSDMENKRRGSLSESEQPQVTVQLLYPAHRRIDKAVSKVSGIFAVGFGVYGLYAVADVIRKLIS